MSENNQNHPAPEGAQKQESTAGKGGQNRRNRYRPHRGGNRPRPENAGQNHNIPQENAPAPIENSGKDHTPPHEKRSNPSNNHSNQKRTPNNKGGGNNRSERKNNGQSNPNRNRPPRRMQENRLYDPYETPSKEEIALSELRAQIVLKSADGTVPTAYSAQPTAPKAEEPVASATEEMLTEQPQAAAPISETQMAEIVGKVEVVGVRFRSAGKMYYFDPHGIQAQKGDFAIVETTRGPEFGDVCMGNTMINVSETVSPLRPLIRIATPEDIAHNAENREKEQKALGICQEKIKARGLEMKLIDVQYAFDNSKLLFYFAAEGRVDFRDLVKDLASVFRTRIELRQIGIRDEAKMLGGIGACGRALCCSTFLPDFAQVSIKMAKEQNLSLNSTKISGVCGRLMCCLRYESDVYTEEIRKTPANDTLVRTEDGVGTVISSNPLAGTIRVVLKDSPDTAPKQYHRDNVTVLGKDRRGGGDRVAEEKKAPEAEE